MEVGNKRHGKNSDKETQSPVIKVFREMIQRENTDPEKANLLKEKQEKRKRKQYSSSRSKSDRVRKSCDSSSSEKNRRSVQYKGGIHDQRVEDYNQRSQSIPFNSEKKDSWWFWQGDSAGKKKSEDTCSCVSCALKRIISSEYTCIACIGVLFLISVLVAFMVLFRAVPMVAREQKKTVSDGMTKKIESLQRRSVGEAGKDRRTWDETLTRHLSSLTGSNGNDFDDGYRELNNLEDAGVSSDSELASVLNTDSLNDGLSSERLRNFYKKLIQTDAQIRNLKKNAGELNTFTNYEGNKYNIDRVKRSLKMKGPKSLLRLYPKKKDATHETPLNLAELHKFNLYYPPITALNTTKRKNRKVKRFINTTEEPTGFLIEKKQILVQYKPHNNFKKVPKCSHAPKESKSHEKQLKHPFYKNTQRLDELLDQFLDNNLPDIMADPFGVDVLFKNKEKLKPHKTNVIVENEVTKRPTLKYMVKEKPKFVVKEHFKPKLDKEFFDMISSINNKNLKYTQSTTPSYDVLLSVSTIVNPGPRKMSKALGLGRTPSLLERVPHIRKLMQVEEDDDEGLGYEDFKEVLTDDSETHDENDKVQNRRRRMENYIPDVNKLPNAPKYSPPGVHNPNWKGPMPLYPDEINSMIKQAAIENVNKITVPNKDVTAEVDDAENDLNDFEYIENYSDTKYGKLVEMAQAYSDYGVLEGKKESGRNDNKGMEGKEVDGRVKMAVNKGRALKAALMSKFKKRKCTVSDGIRFEIRPTTHSREDSPGELMKAIEKHIKVMNEGNRYLTHFQSTPTPSTADYSLFSATVDKEGSNRVEETKHAGKKVTTKDDIDVFEDSSDGVVFAFGKNGKVAKEAGFLKDKNSIFGEEDSRIWKRSLKSINVGHGNDDEKVVTDALASQDISALVYYIDNEDKSNTDYKDIEIMTSILDDNLSNELNKPRVKRDTHEERNLESVLENKSDQKSLPSTNITANKSSGFFENNLITNAIKLNKNGSSDMDISEFFMILSDWFSLLAGAENNSSKNVEHGEDSKSEIMKLAIKPTTSKPESNKSINIQFPSYDSDMIENIGHRSRVLLAIEEPQTTSTESVEVSEMKTSKDKEKSEITSSSSVTETTTTLVTTTPTTSQKNPNTDHLTTQQTLTTPVAKTDKSTKRPENKTIVKRNVGDDSRLIFWNDMYDDEYGVRLDPLDAIRERQNFKGMDLVKKSGNWIQDKVRNIAKNFHGKEKFDLNDVNRMNPYRQETRNKYVKRATEHFDDEEAEESPTSFAHLTAKMKEVCKEAAKAVQQTKNVKVRKEEKEDSMTSSLMQQLVRLMTDLVDFQVEQKTCVKLPPDLQEFLEWLTAPNPEQLEPKNHKVGYNDDNLPEKQTEPVLDLISSSEKEEVHPDTRSDCLGTLHAVQDLMQQLDEMTDEDKSKMTGIREYLENQLQFLHKQLAIYDENQMLQTPSMFDEHNPTGRYRRDLINQRRHRNITNRRRHLRFKRKFIKNFGKKHTRTTASIYDGNPITDVDRLTKFDSQDVKNIDDLTKLDTKDVKEVDDENKVKVEKRNLRDVYYKAVNDAKKPTTIKNFRKEELEGFDNAQIVRIEN